MSKLEQLKALGDAKRVSRVLTNPCRVEVPQDFTANPEKSRKGASRMQVKRGRPRIGEERDKPWLVAKPPMSRRTWYRRQKEQRK